MQMDIQSQGFVLTDGINGPFDPSNKRGADKPCLPACTALAAQTNDH